MSKPDRLVISVMLAVEDTPTAVEWYESALGATELWNLGGVAGLESCFNASGCPVPS